MRANSLYVLFTALACSMTGTALKLTADYDNSQSVTGKEAIRDTEGMEKINTMETRTNADLVDKNNEGNEDIYVKGNTKVYDEIYTGDEDLISSNLHLHRMHLKKHDSKPMRHFDDNKMAAKKRWKREADPLCEQFKYNQRDETITHPYARNSSNGYYSKNSNCITNISSTRLQHKQCEFGSLLANGYYHEIYGEGKHREETCIRLRAMNDHSVIVLTFVDIFRIEYHPECAYDYLEIRDGIHGYAHLMGKVCGQAFPRQMKTTGPNAWLKFHSDDTIEYEGFHIKVDFVEGPSRTIPEECYIPLNGWAGVVDSKEIKQECLSGSGHALDVLWTITAPEDTKIYLNFTRYKLAKPNECGDNVVQVFGSVLELDSALAHYCGSVANPISTKDEPGNIMYVRLYASKATKSETVFNATFTAYKTLDPTKEGDKCGPDLFDCEDNTCIHIDGVCNSYANCRLKTDEGEVCKKQAESTLNQPHILVILVIFSLILSGMSFVFVFKCIRKLYQDHKIIKEHIRQSCEDRLDTLVGSRLTLDAKRLQRDSEPRASLERENHTNEMFKQQRKFSKNNISPTSIDSDFQTHIDLDEEPWRREVEPPVQPENVRIERNGRTRRSDMSKKEESIRSRTKDSEDHRETKEIRDVSVGAPDTKESGCQTRESLFEPATAPSSDGSGSNSRGFSTFGYSGATIVRPSTPAQTNTSEITIELLRQVPSHHEAKPQKKTDRRPISTETTRSAPDVIIVSKPIR